MYEEKELNQNQEQFCVEYTTIGQNTYGNGTRAYLAAFPDCNSEESAASLASRLLRNVKIQDRINELHKENMTKNGVTIESVIADIRHDQMKAREAGLWSVACQLDKLLGQTLAMFTEKYTDATGDKPELPDFTPEELEIVKAEAKLLTMPKHKLEAVFDKHRNGLQENAGKEAGWQGV